MITPDQALNKILSRTRPLGVEQVELREANGRVLAAPVCATDSLPRFDNSAMDGFAVRSADVKFASKRRPVRLRLIGEIQAGVVSRLRVGPGCAARISTGAPIPPGADAVVMQEYCRAAGDRVTVADRESRWGNIRRRGEEIKKGHVALKRGLMLNAGSIAWMAAMGIECVRVYRRPRVGLLRTGTEVVESTVAPGSHQVRDAHGVSLALELSRLGITVEIPPIVPDRLHTIVTRFAALLRHCDVVLTTGGVSVGGHDLFHAAADRLGLQKIFCKVAQKPGKPMVFGRKSSRFWFGLPGNPVSSLFCFYHYVRPALAKMMGMRNPEPVWFDARATTTFRRHPTRTDFLRGWYQDGWVRFAEKQGSHCLGSFAGANVLVRIDPKRRKPPSRRVTCTPIEFSFLSGRPVRPR